MILGVDVSDYQGSPVWTAAAGTISFAWLKATEGTNYTARQFAANKAGCAAAGIKWGAYHFASGTDPVAEARHFLAAGVTGGGLPPVLDAEKSGITSDWCLSFLTTVEQATGVTPMFYGETWLVNHDQRLARFPLWYPNYPTNNQNPRPENLTRPPAPSPWTAYVAWQYTDKGTVPGIAGAVDMNVADPAWFASLTAPPAPPTSSTMESPVIASAQNADGRLEAFEGELDGRVRHRWQVAPNGTWSDWVDLGAPTGTCARGLSAARNADGRLEVFAVAADYSVSHAWQTAPNSGWSGWVAL